MGRDLEDFIKKNFKKAIDNREIQIFYQPVIRTSVLSAGHPYVFPEAVQL